MKKIMFAMALLLSLVSVAAHAQEKTEEGCTDNKSWYVGVNGGLSTKFTHNAWFKNLNPSAGIVVGKWFNPYIGLELNGDAYFGRKQFNAFTMGANEGSVNPYGEIDDLVKAFAVGLSVETNLMNLICGPQQCSRPFEVYAKAGAAYGKDIAKNKSTLDESVNVHFSLPLVYNIGASRQWQVYLEPAIMFDAYDDRGRGTYFEGFPDHVYPKEIHFHSDRMAMQVRLGVNYKFNKCKPAPVVVPVEPTPEPKPVVKPEPKPEPKPVVVPVDTLHEVFYYEIRLSEPTATEKLDKIAAWCKRHADKKVTIDSYADRGTGNPRINVGYAKARATKCAAELEKRGVPAEQMIVNSHGDKIQPFAENDKNRCTIVVGK